MDTQEIFEKVRTILVNQLDISESAVDMDALLQDHLAAFELDMIGIVMDLEEEFDLNITESEAAEFKTVEDIVNYVKENM